jgi:hypothetical protein
MSRFMSAMWVLEVVVLLVAHLVCLVRPSLVFYVLEECNTVSAPCRCCTAPDGISPPAPGAEAAPCEACCIPRGLCTHPEDCCEKTTGVGADIACASVPRCPGCRHILTEDRKACVLVEKDAQTQGLFAYARMLAPFLLTFGLLAGHAAMREDEKVRRNLSFIFAWVYVVFTVLLATDGFSGEFKDDVFFFRALFAALVTLCLYSLFEALRARDGIQRSLSLAGAALYAAVAWLDQRPGVELAVVAELTLFLLVLDTAIGGIERVRGWLFAMVIGWPAVFVVTEPMGMRLLRHRMAAESLATHQLLSAKILERRPATLALLAFVTFALLAHALYAVWPTDPTARRLSGTANTRPSSLWVLWLGQGLLFLGAAVLLLYVHSSDTAGMVTGMKDTPGYLALFEEVKDLYPAMFVAMALLSFSGMQSSREWVWKALCGIFCVFYLATWLTMLLVWTSALFKMWVMALYAPVIVLFWVHARYLWGYREWFSEEVGEGPDGWILVDLVMGPYMMYRTLLTGRRCFHAMGVAAWGRLTVLPRGEAAKGEPAYPDHDFFVPGATFDVTIRFSNERARDDAAADARGAALRISARDGRRFDLMLGTGAYSAAEHVLDQGIITFANALGRVGRRWLARERQYLEGGIAALRRAPHSYTQLVYHSQTVRFWVGGDDERYLVRYRLVKWPLPAERRPTDYLRRELKLRLEGARSESFRLQAQFHRVGLGDGVAFYNPAADWKTTSHEHPWIDLAEITLEDVLSDEDAEKLLHDPDSAPQSLGTPIARSPLDYRSIADSERRVLRRVELLRRWRNEAFGMPADTVLRE